VRVALLYEHPTWSIDLLARMRAREIDVTPIDVGKLNPRSPIPVDGSDLWVNRVNALPSAGRSPTVVAATRHLLLSLELRSQRVFNDAATFALGGSKIAQAEMFDHLGLHTPTTVALQSPADLRSAAAKLGFPLVSKPNVGGSGQGIMRYDSASDLVEVIDAGHFDLGIDGTGVAQKLIESADGLVHRIEMLGSKLLYATQQPIQEGTYNYCAADGCAIGDGTPLIEVVEPQPHLVAHAAEIMGAASADAASIEYLVDADTGEPCFYDFNPYSNFITGYDEELGFNPTDRYIDALLASC